MPDFVGYAQLHDFDNAQLRLGELKFFQKKLRLHGGKNDGCLYIVYCPKGQQARNQSKPRGKQTMTKEQLRAFREFKAAFKKKYGKNHVFKSNKKKLDYTLYLMLYKKSIKQERIRFGFEEENGKIVAITLTWLEEIFEGKPQTSRFAFLGEGKGVFLNFD